MRQITDGVYVIPFHAGFLNMYLIEAGDKLALVDTAISEKQIDQTAAALAKAGRSLDEVGHVLITHAHMDHIGGLAALQQRVNAVTYAHRRDTLVIRGEQSPPRPDPDQLRGLARLMGMMTSQTPVIEPANVSRELSEGDRLDEVLPGLEVIELPGHSHGQVGFWWPERRLLFGGDVMFRWPWGLRMPFLAFTPDEAAARGSIRRVAEMDVDILCLGHGAPINGGASTAIRQLAARL
jgi:glyoxylase-like metal-dependent hydrolase (beta-lactamase superfamily II)